MFKNCSWGLSPFPGHQKEIHHFLLIESALAISSPKDDVAFWVAGVRISHTAHVFASHLWLFYKNLRFPVDTVTYLHITWWQQVCQSFFSGFLTIRKHYKETAYVNGWWNWSLSNQPRQESLQQSCNESQLYFEKVLLAIAFGWDTSVFLTAEACFDTINCQDKVMQPNWGEKNFSSRFWEKRKKKNQTLTLP